MDAIALLILYGLVMYVPIASARIIWKADKPALAVALVVLWVLGLTDQWIL